MTSLTDRYLAATLRSVPAGRREEIATELRASIADMIDDRTAAGDEAPAAERDVLNELGDPAQLAARYADRRLQLIGPTYYLAWQRLLIVLLSIVPAIAGVTVGVVQATVNDNPAGAIGQGVVTALNVALHITFWVTAVFAVLERLGTPLHLPAWNVDQLPDEPSQGDTTLIDVCASIVFLVLFIAFLPWQHFQSVIGDGDRLPILDPALWTSWLPFFLAVLVASTGLEIAKYRARRWTWPLVGVNALLNLAFAVPAIWLLLDDRLLNPEFVARFAWLRDGGLDTVARISVVAIVVISVWDVIDSVVKARRAQR
ncbi:permease prefix domain 1-containing protein [Micromonospora sp. WMMD1082]|uniref:HAAS signaling domain-containing protein n=1 Tax=Micromonospora sp. WMMD1082 TaxID=3016104 RepID=UPI00241635D4|nr:permease prefix domain 1-containing protein [Micromonospora sp. WMMD1082]MDG4798567.1 permease prefix domain 1-containing protein [Micromonospora sp. WMMD1082]